MGTDPELDQAAQGLPVANLGHEKVTQDLNKHGLIHYNQWDYDQAKQFSECTLLDIREKALGPDHHLVATSLNNLAWLYQNQGDYAKAEPLFKRALSIREKALGPDHHLVATSLDNLAWFYQGQVDFAKAEPLFKRALSIWEKAPIPNFKVATTLNNLALIYQFQGDFAKAEQLYKRSLSIREKALGPDHPVVAATLDNFAWLYKSQGDFAEAEQLYKRSLSIREKALGPDHHLVATSQNNLTKLHKAKNEKIQIENFDIKNNIKKAISSNSQVKIKYLSSKNEVSERLISNIEFTDEFDKFGYYGEHIKANCHLRNDERHFKIDRIISFSIVDDTSAEPPKKTGPQERKSPELSTQSPLSSQSTTPLQQDNPIKPGLKAVATASTPRHPPSPQQKSIPPEPERKISPPKIGTNAPKSQNGAYSVFLFWGAVAIFILLLVASQNNDSNKAVPAGSPSPPKYSPEQTPTRSEKIASNSPSVPSVQVIKKVQQLLVDIGYKPGRVDGNLTTKTRDAITAFRQDNRYDVVHDNINETLLSDLQRVKSEYGRRKEAQKLLFDLGYHSGPIDGKPSFSTVSGIIAFHKSRGQQFRGEVIDDLLLSNLRNAVAEKYYKNKSQRPSNSKSNQANKITIICGEGFVSTSDGGCKPITP